MTSGAPSAIDWHLKDSQTCARSSHLHFKRPAIGLFAHPQTLQRITANGSERAHVGRAHAIEQAKKEPYHVAGKDLVPVHASALTLSARARRNHEIMRLFDYRLDQPIHHFGIVAAIAVEKDDDFAIRRD